MTPPRAAPKAAQAFASVVIPLALAVGAVTGCSRPAGVPEAGSVLLRVAQAPAPQTPDMPDELRVWVYDATGVLFRDARFPSQGPLAVAANAHNLGSILVQPGNAVGSLRVHVRGLRNGGRVSDGLLVMAADLRNRATADVSLLAAIPPDLDGDDVPDPIDDCLSRANPDQGGCTTGGTTDASAADRTDDGSGGDGSGGDGSGGDGALGDAGAPTDASTNDAASLGDGRAGDVAPSDARPVDAAGDTATGGDAARPADAADGGGTRDAAVEGMSAATKQVGSSCTTASECVSTFCADGVCCQTACNQPCQQCVLGVCLAVVRRQDVPECAGTSTCNASGRCGPAA